MLDLLWETHKVMNSGTGMMDAAASLISYVDDSFKKISDKVFLKLNGI